MTELAITVRNEDKSMTQKHLIYDTSLTVSREDATLAALVRQAEKDFGDNAQETLLKIKFVW